MAPLLHSLLRAYETPPGISFNRSSAMGPRATYGQWILFRSMERDLIRVNDHYLAHLHDDRIRILVTEPHLIQTTFDLEYEHNG